MRLAYFLFAVAVVSVSALLSPGDSAGQPAPTASDQLDVRPDPSGGVLASATVLFAVQPDIIQTILTDYAHWPDLFDVRMRVAELKIVGAVATTDLRIEHGLLPGERRLVADSRTLPGGGLVTDLVSGDFKRYHRRWTLTPIAGGTQTKADFELLVEIDTMVPDWLIAFAMRQELEAHFRIVRDKARTHVRKEK